MTPLDAFELPLPFETQNAGPTDIQYPFDGSSTFEFTPIYLKFDIIYELPLDYDEPSDFYGYGNICLPT